MKTINGTFDPDGTPWLDAAIETAAGATQEVRLLVSTGSARTVIRRRDAVLLDLWNSREPQTVSLILGEEPDTIRIDHPVQVDRIDSRPSCIGWDILGNWSFRYDFPNRILEFREE